MAESNVKTRHSLELLSHTNGQCNTLLEQAGAGSILNHALESVLPESALRRYGSIDEATNTLTAAGRRRNSQADSLELNRPKAKE
jgi:hypothetical protein